MLKAEPFLDLRSTIINSINLLNQAPSNQPTNQTNKPSTCLTTSQLSTETSERTEKSVWHYPFIHLKAIANNLKTSALSRPSSLTAKSTQLRLASRVVQSVALRAVQPAVHPPARAAITSQPRTMVSERMVSQTAVSRATKCRAASAMYTTGDIHLIG